MSGRGCAQLKRMLESQNIQERPLGAGQQVFIGAPKRIELLAHEIATLGVTGHATASDHSTVTSPMNATCLALNLVRSIISVT
jgi:hypothetical protein